MLNSTFVWESLRDLGPGSKMVQLGSWVVEGAGRVSELTTSVQVYYFQASSQFCAISTSQQCEEQGGVSGL